MSKKFWLLISGSILFIIATLYFNWQLLQPVAISNRGSYGDLFGFANTLFSGLAFVGVIAAILIQSEELKLQRNELQETRAEFEQQNATLKKQAFENTFYQLIANSNSILHSINAGYFKRNNKYLLTQHLISFKKNLRGIAKSKLNITNNISLEIAKEIFNDSESFKENTIKNWRILSPWIKTISGIQEFIFQSDLISDEERNLFNSIFWNQLSDNQIKIIFIYFKFEVIDNPSIIDIIQKSPLNSLSLEILSSKHPVIYFNLSN